MSQTTPQDYGHQLFSDYVKNDAAQSRQFRTDYPLNFQTVQDTGIAGDAKARAAAIEFLSNLGGQARAAALKSNPDLAASLGHLNTEAANVGPSDISSKLHDQALHELDLGGQLSPDQVRMLTQSTRAAYSDRGLAESNPAMFSEMLNLEGAQQSRLRERQGFASGVEAMQYGEKQGDRSFLQGVTAENQAYDPAMTILGLNSQPAAAGSQNLTTTAIQAPLQIAQDQHDYWSTMFNAESAADIAAKNRAAGLESAQMSANASASAGKSSMMGAGIGAAGAIAGAAIIAL